MGGDYLLDKLLNDSEVVPKFPIVFQIILVWTLGTKNYLPVLEDKTCRTIQTSNQPMYIMWRQIERWIETNSRNYKYCY